MSDQPEDDIDHDLLADLSELSDDELARLEHHADTAAAYLRSFARTVHQDEHPIAQTCKSLEALANIMRLERDWRQRQAQWAADDQANADRVQAMLDEIDRSEREALTDSALMLKQHEDEWRKRDQDEEETDQDAQPGNEFL